MTASGMESSLYRRYDDTPRGKEMAGFALEARARMKRYDLPSESFESVLHMLKMRAYRERTEPIMRLLAEREALSLPTMFVNRSDGTLILQNESAIRENDELMKMIRHWKDYYFREEIAAGADLLN